MEGIAALIVAIATLLTAIGGVVVIVRNQKAATASAETARLAAVDAKHAAEASQREVVATKDGVFELGKQIDGRLSELLETTKALARAEGIAEGKRESGA